MAGGKQLRHCGCELEGKITVTSESCASAATCPVSSLPCVQLKPLIERHYGAFLKDPSYGYRALELILMHPMDLDSLNQHFPNSSPPYDTLQGCNSDVDMFLADSNYLACARIGPGIPICTHTQDDHVLPTSGKLGGKRQHHRCPVPRPPTTLLSHTGHGRT